LADSVFFAENKPCPKTDNQIQYTSFTKKIVYLLILWSLIISWLRMKILVFNIAVRLIIFYHNIPNWYNKYNFITYAHINAIVARFVLNVKPIKLVNSLSS